MDLSTLSIDKPDAINFILGQTHFGNVPDMVLVLYNGFEINGVEFHTSTSGTLPDKRTDEADGCFLTLWRQTGPAGGK